MIRQVNIKLEWIHYTKVITLEVFQNIIIYHEKRCLALSWRKSLSYRNQSIDLLCKSMDWFLYNRDLRHERFKRVNSLKSLRQKQRHWTLANTTRILDFLLKWKPFSLLVQKSSITSFHNCRELMQSHTSER